jgi:pullulanase/glycogen debranching enzyme
MSTNQEISREEAERIALRLFEESSGENQIRSSYQDEVRAWHVWQPMRGGGSVLISSTDGTFLFAGSAVPMDEHVSEFARGTRTDPSELEP